MYDALKVVARMNEEMIDAKAGSARGLELPARRWEKFGEWGRSCIGAAARNRGAIMCVLCG
jgi:hypothetical protein